jgi:hypothetical protein
MSSSGSPALNTTPGPSPVSVCAFDVILNIFPKPPVANSTDFEWKTWISPVAIS